MKSHSLLWFCFVTSIVALNISGCKKSGDIESNTATQNQTASTAPRPGEIPCIICKYGQPAPTKQEQKTENNATAAGDDESKQHAETKGSLSKTLIQSVVRNHRSELQACYNKGFDETKRVAQKIVCQWTISENGDVTKASIVQSEMNNKVVQKCIVDTIMTWTFPAPKGGEVSIEYPIALIPGE